MLGSFNPFSSCSPLLRLIFFTRIATGGWRKNKFITQSNIKKRCERMEKEREKKKEFKRFFKTEEKAEKKCALTYSASRAESDLFLRCCCWARKEMTTTAEWMAEASRKNVNAMWSGDEAKQTGNLQTIRTFSKKNLHRPQWMASIYEYGFLRRTVDVAEEIWRMNLMSMEREIGEVIKQQLELNGGKSYWRI